MVPPLRGAGEDLDPASARPPAGFALQAQVALAQAEQERLSRAMDARQALEALVRPMEREVEPRARDVPEAVVVLAHLGHEPAVGAAATRSGRRSGPTTGS